MQLRSPDATQPQDSLLGRQCASAAHAHSYMFQPLAKPGRIDPYRDRQKLNYARARRRRSTCDPARTRAPVHRAASRAGRRRRARARSRSRRQRSAETIPSRDRNRSAGWPGGVGGGGGGGGMGAFPFPRAGSPPRPREGASAPANSAFAGATAIPDGAGRGAVASGSFAVHPASDARTSARPRVTASARDRPLARCLRR